MSEPLRPHRLAPGTGGGECAAQRGARVHGGMRAGQHSFHPKVWLLVGADEAALLVGSGNLTQSGFTQNAEIFEAVRLPRDGPHRRLATDVILFLAGLRGLWARGERD